VRAGGRGRDAGCAWARHCAPRDVPAALNMPLRRRGAPAGLLPAAFRHLLPACRSAGMQGGRLPALLLRLRAALYRAAASRGKRDRRACLPAARTFLQHGFTGRPGAQAFSNRATRLPNRAATLAVLLLHRCRTFVRLCAASVYTAVLLRRTAILKILPCKLSPRTLNCLRKGLEEGATRGFHTAASCAAHACSFAFRSQHLPAIYTIPCAFTYFGRDKRFAHFCRCFPRGRGAQNGATSTERQTGRRRRCRTRLQRMPLPPLIPALLGGAAALLPARQADGTLRHCARCQTSLARKRQALAPMRLF